MISAEIIADSVFGENRITTFVLEYPRFIHAELMTHRLFSRNAASSRAIPIDKMIEMVESNPAMPVQWGLNQAGMQASGTHDNIDLCKHTWRVAAIAACHHARQLQALGLHKQIVNRVLEPFQVMKTIVTATEFDNFFWLRCHKDAQPEIHVLADKMYELYQTNKPKLLLPGDWHTPYYKDGYWTSCMEDPLEIAVKISSSCTAQVSFRQLDDSVDKAISIYDRLVESTPVHASPLEHPATPITAKAEPNDRVDDLFGIGITHMDKENQYWSGNLKGWVQYRQTIEGNACWNYKA